MFPKHVVGLLRLLSSFLFVSLLLAELIGNDHRFTAKWSASVPRLAGHSASFSRSFNNSVESSWTRALQAVHKEVWTRYDSYKHESSVLDNS